MAYSLDGKHYDAVQLFLDAKESFMDWGNYVADLSGDAQRAAQEQQNAYAGLFLRRSLAIWSLIRNVMYGF